MKLERTKNKNVNYNNKNDFKLDFLKAKSQFWNNKQKKKKQ
jgi:hypothetical protein